MRCATANIHRGYVRCARARARARGVPAGAAALLGRAGLLLLGRPGAASTILATTNYELELATPGLHRLRSRLMDELLDILNPWDLLWVREIQAKVCGV